MNEKIDFVVLWVDGSDRNWLKEKNQYSKTKIDITNGDVRFRDWDNLKYWFRGVEKFAPWVNKVYFVTWGHLPDFLDTTNEKLVIVNHKDYIDKKYLPTFNSNSLDLNLKNIDDLSEHFVYFNDDMFITDYVKPSDFFLNGLPRDEYTESPIVPFDEEFSHNLLNNVCVVNKYYNKKKRPFSKTYSFKYGIKNNIKTLSSSFYDNYIGFANPHIPQAFIKEDFRKLWKLEPELCDLTSSNKFRTRYDITQYLIRYLRLASGKFSPRSYKFGKLFEISNENGKALESIIKQKYKLICLNDVNSNINFEKAKEEIKKAFEEILPEKCSFEK